MMMSFAPQAAPRANGDLYPGAWPEDSCIVTFDEILDFEGIPEGAAPLLAVGSNASPAQLRHKFLDEPDLLNLAMSRAHVTGLGVAYVPWEISYGAYPATPVLDPASDLDLMVQWIDPDALAVIDQTEEGYTRTWLTPADGVTVQIEGQVLDGVWAYVADSGPLTIDGQVVRMITPWQAAAGKETAPYAVASQAELRTLLGLETPPAP